MKEDPLVAPGSRQGGALRGLRVMVTRAAAQAGDLCAMLEARGATPITAPMVRIERLPATDALRAAVRRQTSYDWIIFTSVNAVDSFLDAVEEIAGSVPGRQADRPMIAAVGPATAAALARRGVTPQFVPADHTAAALAEGLAAGAASGIAGARILFPRAEIAREEAVIELRRRGAFVEDIPLYRTRASEISRPELEEIGKGVDLILFMSGSAVHAFCDRAAEVPALAEAVRGALIACLGPSTADAARGRGLAVGIVPGKHTAEGLVAALERHFGAGQATPKG